MNEQWSRKICYQTNNDYETRIRQLEDVVHLLLARSELQRPPPSFTSIAPVGSFRYSRYKGLVPLLSKSTSESLATDWKKSLLGGAYPPSLSSFRSKSSQPSPQSIPHRRLGAENWLSVDPNPNPSQLVSLVRPILRSFVTSCLSSISLPPEAHTSSTITSASIPAIVSKPHEVQKTSPHANTPAHPTSTLDPVLDSHCHPGDLTLPDRSNPIALLLTLSTTTTTPNDEDENSLTFFSQKDKLDSALLRNGDHPVKSNSVDRLPFSDHPVPPKAKHNVNLPETKTPVILRDNLALPPAPAAKTERFLPLTSSMQETNHPTITSLPPSHTSTPPLAPIQGISTQASANDVVDTLSSPSAPFLVHSTRPLPAPSACSSPINPTAKAYPHKFDVHAMGSIDVVDKSDDPIDPQLNLDYTLQQRHR
ncbi:hypothetical protein MJO28_015542 [Puccinia striiformis f. sp. tritici]|uniref:Uncharacterized protein n=1 Tax=Puccinia striiformis f. sp. tritici TaxID=168172 RepID=A0ACC0DP47_9BASI|nr:hypothetical protein MJO28_015542 [Puccinia striiformis f. sp. tritici]